MGFKVLVLGVGAQGRVLSYLFDKTDSVEELRLAGRRFEKVKRYAETLDRAIAYKADAYNIDEICNAAKGVDLIVNAVLPEHNLYVMKAALKVNANYIDMAFGPPYDNIDKELELGDEFKKRDLVAITSTGITPGTTNILAACAADELDKIDYIKIVDAEVVDSDVPISSWSPETFIADCIEYDTFVYEDGELKRVKPFSGEEVINFPVIGPQKVYYHAHEEQVTLWRFIKKPIKKIEFKIGGPALEFLAQLYSLGLLSREPIEVKGVKIAPLDVYLALVPRPPTPEQLREYIEKNILRYAQEVTMVEVTGYRDNEFNRYTYYVYSPPIKEIISKVPPANHGSYLTSTGCYILSRMIGEGLISERGVIVPEALNREERVRYIKANMEWIDPHIKIELKVEKVLAI